MGADNADGENAGVSIDDITNKIQEYSSSDLKILLKKIWLSHFHRWCMAHCNGGTQEMMDDILKAESDWEAIQLIYNSFAGRREGSIGKDLRVEKFFNKLGHLYPGRTKSMNDAPNFTGL